MTEDPILEFSGDYRWLSNFHDYIIDLGGRMFASSEHAYQATKTFDPVWQKDIQQARSPGSAKRLGAACPLRDDWEDVKVEMMRLVLAAKFHPGTGMADRLLLTGDRILVEGNTWNDTFWGACWEPLWMSSVHYGRPLWAERAADTRTTDQLRGTNQLGLLLMARRAELREAGL